MLTTTRRKTAEFGVLASSAAAERMFSWSGDIFSTKRRCLKARTLAALVFLKLNEDLY